VQRLHNFWSFTLLHGYGGCGIPLDQDKIGPLLHLAVLGRDAYERLKIFRVLFKVIKYRRHFDGFRPCAADGEEFHSQGQKAENRRQMPEVRGWSLNDQDYRINLEFLFQ